MTQFRIDRIRFTWKGAWNQGTFYTKDDIVQYGGKSYVCLVGHTSTLQTSTTVNGITTNTGFYTDLFQINTAVTPNVPNPYWQLWFDGYTYKGNWTNGVIYNLGDIVTYDSLVYICNTGHTSVSSTMPISITSASGDGNFVTYGFSTQIIQPFKVGSSVTITGITPSSYNGTFTVVNATVNSITVTSTVVAVSTINQNSTLVSAGSPGLQLGLEYNQTYWTSYAITDNWQSTWTANTRYQVGDVVKNGGTTYRCTTAHISAPATAFISITGISSSSPSIGFVTLSFGSLILPPFAIGSTITVSGVGIGYNGTWTVTACTSTTVVFANSTTTAATAGKVSGPSQLGLEYNTSNWTIETQTDKWGTEWTIATRYKVGDIVRYGAYVYRCTTAHVSSSILALGLENDSSSWQTVLAGVDYKSAWQANFRYKLNDVVKFGANAYIANVYHTSTTTFDATKWNIYAPGYEYKDQWNASTIYVPGDVVKFHGYSWVCIAANSNSDPSISPTYWSFSTSGYFTSGDWASGVNYYPGDVVRRNGQLYVAISDSFSYDPSAVGNTVYWTLIVSGSYWANRWTIGVVYAVGDVVTYYATSYRCLQTNTASNGNNPLTDLARAYWNIYAPGDRFEVIQNPGDITTYTTTQVALPIGTPGMVLKSNGVQPVWSQYGQINNIYYVATSGTDAVNYGLTLNSPFATVAYACNYVLKGAYFQNTAYLLTQNKVWLVAEMYNWMLYQKQISSAPFSPSSVFDPQRMQRDAEYIIDAIIYDITRGGNSQSVASAFSYFQSGTNSFYTTSNNVITSTEMPFFTAALARLNSLISNALSQSAPSSSYQGLMNASTANVIVTGASGNGTTATLTFNTLANQPFTVGESIIVSGILPAGYNGTYVVSAVSNTSVSYSNVTMSTYVSGGSVLGSNVTQFVNLSYILEANAVPTVSSLLGIITTALNSASAVGIPAANTGVTSTIFVKDGTYNEVLPISVPENCAIVGDELRGTIVQPASKTINFTGSIALQALTITALTSTILTAQSITATTAGILGTTKLGGIVTVASTAGLAVGNIFTSTGNTLNLGGLANNTYYVGSIISSTQLTLSSTYPNALAGTYITLSTATITSTTFTAYNNISIGQWISSNTMYYPTQITGQLSGITGGPGIYSVDLSQTVSSVAMIASYYTGNMFYVRNGAGIRNMTLSGLTGTLGPLNSYLTQRPTAGAYVSLDPGAGPYDTSVWIFRKSPYVQNVTTFGTGCVGLKIDGALHNGGNKSVVANDFTHVLSDGIGAWCTGAGSLTELVSVFSYYCHAGYLSEAGGRIRATNGNSSYGTYGVVAETYDASEVPITGTVFNRYYQAQIQSAFAGQANNKILLLEYANMGQDYTNATISFAGAGTLASVIQDEFRDSGIFETHLIGQSYGLGGSGYGSAGSQAQAGTTTSITVATADSGSISTYLGMRLIIVSGTGVGQYGYITAYNTNTKVISISAESTGQAGWDHVIPGTPAVAVLDTTTQYAIEPRPSFVAPAYSATSKTLPNLDVWTATAYGAGYFVTIGVDGLSAYSNDGVNWIGGGSLGPAITWQTLAYGNGYFVAIGNGSSTASYSINQGQSWTTSASMPSNSPWTSVVYGNGRFVAVSSGGVATAISTNGTSWTAGGNLPSSATWSGVAYGSIGTWVAVANGGTASAYSTNGGATWVASNGLPSSQNWVGVTWGNGRFVALAGGVLGSSTSTAAAYSFDGITWIAGTLPSSQNWVAVKYGQGLFMAIATATTVSATSQDGLVWTQQALPVSTYWNDVAFGNPTIIGAVTPTWVAVSGYSLLLSNYAANILAGATARGRIVTSGGTITLVKMWEPGSGYRTTPTLLITDPNVALNSGTPATLLCRTANGVLAQPTWLNRGQNYQTSTTRVTVSGNGVADILQGPGNLIVTGIQQAPTPGAGMLISGNGLQYNIVIITPLGGTTYQFQLSVNLDNNVQPVNGTAVSIRVKYSQARLTGHDFLYIGTGNFSTTNYPNVNTNTALQNQQIQFNGGGRVFVVSTDQDGNFKVGNLFGVQQATGIVTVNASLFNLNGVSALSLGGVSVGQNAVVVTQFSTDGYFTANSDAIIPTQKAIKAYVGRAISLGGSNAATGTAIAGTVGVGVYNGYNASIFSSVVGGTIYMGRTGTATVNKVNFTGSSGGTAAGVDGGLLAMAFFHHGFGGSQF